jgi:AraC family transcriptional regulator of adaptative response/methylated-DNA-[protein]-cysteine methyltransferase
MVTERPRATFATAVGHRRETIRYAIAECRLGWTLIALTERGICMIELGDTPEALRERLRLKLGKAKLSEASAELSDWVAKVVAMIEAPSCIPHLPLDIQGTAFQQRVWEAVRTIPAGSTLSYRQVAEQIGAPKAARAVARACASNSIAIAIPCHRVVRSDGSSGGFGWGVERRNELLRAEAGISAAMLQHQFQQ